MYPGRVNVSKQHLLQSDRTQATAVVQESHRYHLTSKRVPSCSTSRSLAAAAQPIFAQDALHRPSAGAHHGAASCQPAIPIGPNKTSLLDHRRCISWAGAPGLCFARAEELLAFGGETRAKSGPFSSFFLHTYFYTAAGLLRAAFGDAATRHPARARARRRAPDRHVRRAPARGAGAVRRRRERGRCRTRGSGSEAAADDAAAEQGVELLDGPGKPGQKSTFDWKRRVHYGGEKLMDRIEYQEWSLKGIDPALGPNRHNPSGRHDDAQEEGSGEGQKSGPHKALANVSLCCRIRGARKRLTEPSCLALSTDPTTLRSPARLVLQISSGGALLRDLTDGAALLALAPGHLARAAPPPAPHLLPRRHALDHPLRPDPHRAQPPLLLPLLACIQPLER